MKTHAQKLGEQCVKAAERKWGHAWRRLSNSQQRAAVCEEVVTTILMVDVACDEQKAKAFDHVTTIARSALNALNLRDEREENEWETRLRMGADRLKE